MSSLFKDKNYQIVIEEFIGKIGVNNLEFFIILNEIDKEYDYKYSRLFICLKDKESFNDDILFDLQDKYGWPYAHYLVNSNYIINVFTVNEINKDLFKKLNYSSEDIKELKGHNFHILVNNDNLDKFLNNIEKYEKDYNDYIVKNNIDHGIFDFSFARNRSEFNCPDNKITLAVKREIDNYIDTDEAKKLLVYGRKNASGKSQILFNIMNYLYRINYPFIFREVFYFHVEKYKKSSKNNEFFDFFIENQDDNKWLKKYGESFYKQTGKKPVLILDELDVDNDEFEDYFVIKAEKSILHNENFEILDIIKDNTYDIDYIYNTLKKELDLIKITLDTKIINEIAENAFYPHYSEKYYSPYLAKKLFSYSYIMDNKNIKIRNISKYKDIYFKDFIKEKKPNDSFHCEYILHKDKKLIFDDFVEFDVKKIIK